MWQTVIGSLVGVLVGAGVTLAVGLRTSAAAAKSARIAQKTSEDLDIWRQREETFRLLRWAADCAVARNTASSIMGQSVLDVLVHATLAQDTDRPLLKAVSELARQVARSVLVGIVTTATQQGEKEEDGSLVTLNPTAAAVNASLTLMRMPEFASNEIIATMASAWPGHPVRVEPVFLEVTSTNIDLGDWPEVSSDFLKQHGGYLAPVDLSLISRDAALRAVPSPATLEKLKLVLPSFERFVTEVGGSQLSDSESHALRVALHSQLKSRVGRRLYAALDETQRHELEQLIEQGNLENQYEDWLKTNVPTYQSMVKQEMGRLKREKSFDRPKASPPFAGPDLGQ